jgi:hypothetical protein
MWAFVAQPLASRDDVRLYASIGRAEFQAWADNDHGFIKYSDLATLVLSWYLGTLSDGEIYHELTKRDRDRFSSDRTVRELLERVGGQATSRSD